MSASIAIPFYNTHEFITDTIDVFLCDNYFDEIIIVDDCSNEPLEIKHPKIKIIRNSKNLGAFKNKYKAVSLCKNDWVFLLDSDNNVDLSNLDLLKQQTQFFSKEILYIPNKLKLININLDHNLHGNIVDYSFVKKPLNKIDAKVYLKNSDPIFEWFMNTGNFFLYKNYFLNIMKHIIDSSNNKFLEADAFVFFYEWLNANYYVNIIKGFEINHILRKNSYSHSTGDKNKQSLDFYKKKLLSL